MKIFNCYVLWKWFFACIKTKIFLLPPFKHFILSSSTVGATQNDVVRFSTIHISLRVSSFASFLNVLLRKNLFFNVPNLFF